MSAITVIVSTICLLILPTSKAADCTFPRQTMLKVPETIGPKVGPIMNLGPQTGDTRIVSRVGDHNLDRYFRIQAKGWNRSDVYLTRTLNVDFIRDVPRTAKGELIVPMNMECLSVDSTGENVTVFTYYRCLIVSPVDNYPPEFLSTALNIREDTPIGSIVGNIRNLVIDRDFPDYTRIIRFSTIDRDGILQGLANGDVILSRALDYEAEKTYQVRMSVTNSVNQTAYGTVTVNLINVNDSPVRFVYRNCTSKCVYVVKVSEANKDSGIRAVDADNDPIEYSINAILPVSETGVMGINKATGNLLHLQYPNDRNLRNLTVIVKAQANSSLPAARNSTIVSINHDFAEVRVEFEFLYPSTSGSDQVLVVDLHVAVCVMMVYRVFKRVF